MPASWRRTNGDSIDISPCSSLILARGREQIKTRRFKVMSRLANERECARARELGIVVTHIRRRSPLDLLEQTAELSSSTWVHHFDKRNLPEQMSIEVFAVCSILIFDTAANAVRQRGLKTVVVRAKDVQVVVDDKSSNSLAHAASHDAGLVVIYRETLVDRNSGNV